MDYPVSPSWYNFYGEIKKGEPMKYSVEFHMMFVKAEVEAVSEEEAEQIVRQEVYVTTTWDGSTPQHVELYQGEFELAMIEEN
jgi:hypothetical protein